MITVRISVAARPRLKARASFQAAGNSPLPLSTAERGLPGSLRTQIGHRLPCRQQNQACPTSTRPPGKEAGTHVGVEAIEARGTKTRQTPPASGPGPCRGTTRRALRREPARRARRRCRMDVEIQPPGPLTPSTAALPPDLSVSSEQLQPGVAPAAAIRRRAPIACRRCVLVQLPDLRVAFSQRVLHTPTPLHGCGGRRKY